MAVELDHRKQDAHFIRFRCASSTIPQEIASRSARDRPGTRFMARASVKRPIMWVFDKQVYGAPQIVPKQDGAETP